MRKITAIQLIVITASLAVPTKWLLADGAVAAPSAPAASVSGLPILKVEGNNLVTNGHPVLLRGINWGWWHLAGTQYSEADMRLLAGWGANVVRLAFSYNDLETDGNSPMWKENGFKDITEVAQWARRYGIYVILDMHVVPGGQSTASYCAGGHNLLWKDRILQDRFVALWSEIARRYRDRPEIAGYELLNEPGSNEKTPELLRNIDQRAIAAIRAVDPGKIIVVGGDNGSGPGDLNDTMKFPDPNILYTFHWYLGAGGNEDWVSDAKQESGMSGTRDWVKIEKTFLAPPGADHMSVTLRSTSNSGTAWFDDVEVKNVAGKVLHSATFDKGTQGYHPEAFPETMAFDSSTGHDKPGSLKVHASTEFNDWAGWVGERLPIEPGHSYHVSMWVKLDHATGDTFLNMGFFRTKTQIDLDAFQKKIISPVEFAKKFNVPVWVGEFGCDNSEPDLQVQWVNDCILLFEKNGLSWTYWDHKDTAGPMGMGLQPEFPDGRNRPVNERLLAALRAGWVLNRPF